MKKRMKTNVIENTNYEKQNEMMNSKHSEYIQVVVAQSSIYDTTSVV